MSELKYFLLGFIFVYAIQVFDIIMNILNSYSAIMVTKCQVKINEIGGKEDIGDPYAVGFQYYPEEDEYEDGDYVD